MKLTMNGVLQLFKDKALSPVAGITGLQNTVSSVNIMDAPDIEDWAKPEELILTTAYSIKDKPDLQERLIQKLNMRGCAGLGIKTKRFLPEVPQKMRSIANELGFPLIELPLELSLAEIMNPIIRSIVDHQSYLLKRSSEIHKALTAITINGGGINSIINCLSQLTQCPVGYYDISGLLLHHCIPQKFNNYIPEEREQITAQLFQPRTPENPIQKTPSQTLDTHNAPIIISGIKYLNTTYAIMSCNETLGYISLIQSDNNFTDIDLLAVEHACTVAALELMKQKAIAESRKFHSRDILEYILFGNISEANNEIIAASALAQAKYYKFMVIEPDNNKNIVTLPLVLAQIYRKTHQITNFYYPMSILSEKTGKIIVLLVTAQNFSKETELFSKLKTALAKIDGSNPISIGLGTLESNLFTVRNSFHDALASLTLGRIVKGPGTITFPQEVAGYGIFSHKETYRILSHTFSPIIEKLEDYDQTNDTEFSKTLERYLECDKNLAQAAKELFIHRNTLANRLEKITDICGLDIKNGEQLFCLRLAFRQHKIRQEYTEL